MDSGNIGQNSGGPSGVPAKRKRGRPPKDPNQRQAEAAQVSHDLGGEQPYIPQTADILGGREGEVGQMVIGVVEAEFEAGYLLSVRIGDSNINMKGVVFKPEHEVQITPENDVAPYLPMIGRQDVPFPAGNLAQSPSQNAGVQTETVPGKRKYRSRKAPASVPLASIPQAGPKDIFTPVILEPVKNPSGMPKSDHGDEAVHMVEPLSVLPPNLSLPAGRIFMSTQGTSEEKSKQMEPTDVDTRGSSNSSDTKTDDGKAIEKSSPEDSGVDSKQEQGKTNEHVFAESSVAMSSAPVVIPLFNYGTGNMTELLQAQEDMKDMKDTQGQVAEEPRLPTGFENSEPNVEFDPKNQEPHDSKAGHM